MGGMLSARFALMYPSTINELVLTDPLGLEDWKALGVPWINLDASWTSELASTYASIRAYEQVTYYVNTWQDSYDTWFVIFTSLNLVFLDKSSRTGLFEKVFYTIRAYETEEFRSFTSHI